MQVLRFLSRMLNLMLAFRRVDPRLAVNALVASLERQKQELLLQEKYSDPRRLNRHQFQVFSQNGEDGMIHEIFRRIGTTNKVFLEIGVGNGLENNTTFLLQQGWTGFWIEGDRRSVSFINRHFNRVIQKGQLKLREAFVKAEVIAQLLTDLAVPKEIELLSIDIDRNSYWVLRAILAVLVPRVIVVEYNALMPAHLDWKVDYIPQLAWNGTSYMSASLKAYELLGREYEYSLVGCEMCGVNAFFVRNDLCDGKFLEPYTAENHHEPLRDFLIHRVGPTRSFTDSD